MRRNEKQGVSRRDVLRYGAAGGAVAALGPLAGLSPAQAGVPGAGNGKFVVIVNLFGGNDGLATIIPASSAVYGAYAGRRPGIAVNIPGDYPAGDPNPFMLGPEYIAHPALAKFAELYQAGDAAVVQNVGYPNENLSHFTSEDVYSRGVRGSFGSLGVLPSGWIARFVQEFAPNARTAIGVGVGQRRDFKGGSVDPLAMSQLSSFVFDRDNRYRDNFQFRLETVRQMLADSAASGPAGLSKEAMEQAHGLVDEVQAAAALTNSQDYSDPGSTSVSSPSRYLRDIAKLIRGGFPTCLYYTGFGGFDTHGDQGGGNDPGARHFRLLARLDNALRAFSDEMKDLGRWDDCVIVVISEFGRRNFENGSQGTDHGHAYPLAITGGGVNAGVFGGQITADLINDERWMPMEVDFRDVYREVLGGHLGVPDFTNVFPEPQGSVQTFGLLD